MNPMRDRSPTIARCVFTMGLAAALVGVVCGCDEGRAGGGHGPSAYPYKVVATVGMIADIVRQVAGTKATVEGIISEGVDPHQYKPRRGDVVLLQSADVVFYNGLLLEGKMVDVLEKVKRDGKPTTAVTELLDDQRYVMTGPQGHYDPHVWMDVRGWMLAVKAVAKALSEYDPTNADFYHANAETYITKLEKLDAYARRVMASIPPAQRVLVTAHDAFNYMGRAYGIEVEGIQGISTESEAGLKRINELAKMLADRKIKAVFIETSVSDEAVKALIEGAQALGHHVVIGGLLFSDAMGKPGTYEGTYIGMIDHNVTTITRALGGEAPAGGFRATLESKQQ